MRPILLFALPLLAASLAVSEGRAQGGLPGPPSVGVVKVTRKPVTESNEFVGRIQAVDRVDVVARVTAFLEQRAFKEGAEVEKGQLLYRLERGPFEADTQAKAAAVAQNQALLRNAVVTLGRASSLLSTPAGQQSNVDTAQANQGSQAAQVAAAQAQLKASQINLDYTEIHAPVAGKITRTNVTEGNVVSPSSGVLATIVSQDPMYVLFPVSVRTALDLREKYATRGGLSSVVVKLRLPNGRMDDQSGNLEYIEPTVSTNTDTLIFRATIPNPPIAGVRPGSPGNRELTDGEFVTAVVESIQPVQALAVPRAAVGSDQQGNYLMLVNGESKVELRRITLGQSTPETAVIVSGVAEGDTVIVEGLNLPQVRPGAPVKTFPLGAPPTPPGGGAAPKPAGT